MATAPKRLIGTMDCWSCHREIPVKQSEGGTLHFPCPYCSFPAYAKKGEECHDNAMAALKNQPKQAPAPENKAPPATKAVAAPTPAPAPRRASSIFDLGSAA